VNPLGVDFNLLYCFENPRRAIEAVAWEKPAETTPKGVERGEVVVGEGRERSSRPFFTGWIGPEAVSSWRPPARWEKRQANRAKNRYPGV
jgi:hypothetical protein